MLKKITIILASAMLVLTACTPSVNNDDEVVQNEDEDTDTDTDKKQKSIVSKYQQSDNDYRTILPYQTSASRGVITNQIGSRADIDELETGLRRLSKDYYDPEKYFFEEGQYLTSDMLYNWLDTYPTDGMLKQMKKSDDYDEQDIKIEKRALNPPLDEEEDLTDATATKEDYKNNPKYLSHILEQNFLEKHDGDTVELAGVSLGIALKSTFTYKADGRTKERDISSSEMMNKGKEIAQTVLKRVRDIEELSNVPVMIALYRESDRGSPVPGSFVAKTGVKAGQASINEWETVKEENILFPSDKGQEKYSDTQQLVQNFSTRIEDYFPDYVGVTGKGFFKNQELQKLTFEIPLDFYGKGQMIGFTQYTYGLVKEMFQDYYDLEVTIKSSEKMESFIYRGAGEDEATIHVFDS